MDLRHAPEPDPRAGRAVLELPPRVLEKRDRRRRQPGRPLSRISWYQAGDALGPVAIPPLADRLAGEAKMLTRAEQTVRLHIGHDAQPAPDRPPILALHIRKLHASITLPGLRCVAILP